MKTSSHSSRKSLASRSRRRGISNAHAFAVGKATGVRLNASHAAITGAALHSAKKHRENARKMFKSSSVHSSTKNRFSSSNGTATINPQDVTVTPPELPSLKYFYLLFIPVIIFFIIIFIVMFLSIFRII